MTLTCKRLFIGIVACTLLLTGCNKESESSESSDDSAATEDIPATWETVKTDCSELYGLFLKLGTLDIDGVKAELPDAAYSSEGDEHTWEMSTSPDNSYCYKQYVCTLTSVYTRTFNVLVDDINMWIDGEVQGFDTLFGVNGERQTLDGVTWAYNWDTYLENCKLEVYSTGETGRYIALISFTRQGETGVPENVIIDERSSDVSE